MSIASEIERIKTNIANAYTACEGKGATLPAILNSANLAECIASITGGGEPIEPPADYVQDGIYANYSGYDSKGGTTWVDSVNGKNITMYNNPVFDSETHSWTFNGSNQYGVADMSCPTGDVTIEAYGILPEQSTNAGFCVRCGTVVGWQKGYGVIFGYTTTDGIRASANIVNKDSNAGQSIKLANLSFGEINKKTKVVIRRTSSTGKFELYVKNANGEEITSITTYTGSIVPKENKLLVGLQQLMSSGNNGYMKGSMYAIRVYNRVLTDEEIAQNHAKDVRIYGE